MFELYDWLLDAELLTETQYNGKSKFGMLSHTHIDTNTTYDSFH